MIQFNENKILKAQNHLKTLSNAELVLRFGKLVQTERKITHLVLECIAEMDTRRLYLEKAYPSLYEFLTQEFGYSPSAAIRRIESARLLREIPEISEKIEKGSLNLSQLSKVQQALRTSQKNHGERIDTKAKQELLNKIENTTQNQTELILAQELNLPLIREEKERIHQDESVTLTLTFSKEEMALLEKAQDIVAHAVPEKKWAKLVVYLAEKEIKRRLAKGKCKNDELVSKNELIVGGKKEGMLVTTEKEGSLNIPRGQKVRKPLPLSLQKQIRQKYSCCQYRDPQSQKQCGSKRFLEIDHLQPVWAGGGNEAENLTLLCSQHNRHKYAKEADLHPLRW